MAEALGKYLYIETETETGRDDRGEKPGNISYLKERVPILVDDDL